MNYLQRKIVIAMCQNDMNASRVARTERYHSNTILYHLDQIKKITGLNPKSFFDLIKLYEMATKEEEEENRGID